MTDQELTILCAEAMGYKGVHISHDKFGTPGVHYVMSGNERSDEYRPLHDDAQCMALVKQFGLQIYPAGSDGWTAAGGAREEEIFAHASDLNRAIVEHVARRMQQAKP